MLLSAAAFAGRQPAPRSLRARPPGRMAETVAAFRTQRWRRLLDPPPDAELRAARLGGDLRRSQDLQRDIARADGQLAALLE